MIFALDELPQLDKLHGVRSLLSVGRSKGAVCVLGVQDTTQLRLLYGADEAQLWQSLLNTKIISRHVAGAAANAICGELIGNEDVAFYVKTVSQGRDGHSASWKWEHLTRPVLMPEQLEQELGMVETADGQRLRALVLGFGDVYRLDWLPCFWPIRRDAVDPADWLER